MKQLFLFMCAGLLWSACTPNLSSSIPEIQLEELGPEHIVALEYSIYMRISFFESDGDLGENLTSENNLFVVDERLELAHEFRISNMVPGGAEVPIQGELEWAIPSVFLTNSNGESEFVTYRIYVVDRAGNKSNTITTAPITILP
jgi:hypothetical protein